MPALPGLELTCFGAPTASVDGAAPVREVLWRKHLGLLVYLALSPNRRRSREHLIGLFWAESPQEKARRSLNESLFRLREGLGEERLVSDGTSVVLNDRGLEVDALRFAAQAERAPLEAVRLLRGKFLEGFRVDEAPEFEEWMSAERRRYDALAATVHVGAGKRELTDRRFTVAADHARRALDLEPHAEPAIRLLMEALDLGGDSSAALAAYHEFGERLQRETGEQPSKSLAAYAERIRKRSERPRDPAAAAREPPLVGRDELHRDVFETLAAGLAGSGARTIVITGAPGMGRTRLLGECLRRSEMQGAVLVMVRPLESDHDARWSALRHLLRAGLADAPGLPAARPEALAALAGIAQELAGRFQPREPRDVADVAAALTAVLAAVADEAPLALAIDDAHWADGPTLAALHAAIGGLARARVVFLVTVANGVGAPLVELQQLQAAVARSLPGTVVRLDPLTDADLALLVAHSATWCQDNAERARLTRRLAHETGGSPLFMVTLLGALEKATTLRADLTTWPPKGLTTDAPLPFSLPSVVRLAVEVRLGELSKEELAVLCAASIAGQGLDLDLVAAVTERPRADVERALPALERRRLVVFDGTRYTFVAPLVAKSVRAACLTPGERRRLEQRAVDALAGREDLESRVLRGELLARIAPDAQAFAFVLSALRDARVGGGTRLARRAEMAGDQIAAAAKLDRAELDALQA